MKNKSVKILLVSLVLNMPLLAFADMARPLATKDLKCTTNNRSLNLLLAATPNKGSEMVVFQNNSRLAEWITEKDLLVASEGNVYIQQVTNRYNIFLMGVGLNAILAGKSGKVSLSGTVEFFNTNLIILQNKTFKLNCVGTLQ